MKKIFIVANWKSNKTEKEINDWFSQVANAEVLPFTEKEIIICPSFVYLALVQSLIKKYNLSFKVAAEDISPFGKGAYTGEVNGEQIQEYADYVLIGHSERRKNFFETDEIVAKKVEQALAANLSPIVCIQNNTTEVPKGVTLLAYEPPDAISTSGPDAKADDPKKVSDVFAALKSQRELKVLYGGSVDEKNIASFTHEENIDGVLVGGASLAASSFINLIKNG